MTKQEITSVVNKLMKIWFDVLKEYGSLEHWKKEVAWNKKFDSLKSQTLRGEMLLRKPEYIKGGYRTCNRCNMIYHPNDLWANRGKQGEIKECINCKSLDTIKLSELEINR